MVGGEEDVGTTESLLGQALFFVQGRFLHKIKGEMALVPMGIIVNGINVIPPKKNNYLFTRTGHYFTRKSVRGSERKFRSNLECNKVVSKAKKRVTL